MSEATRAQRAKTRAQIAAAVSDEWATAREVWRRLDMWGILFVRTTLREIAAEGTIERRFTPEGTSLYRRRS